MDASLLSFFGGRFYAIVDHGRPHIMQYFAEDSVVIRDHQHAHTLGQIWAQYNTLAPTLHHVTGFAVAYSDPISGYTVVNFQGLYEEGEQGVLRGFLETFALQPIPGPVLGVAHIFSAVFRTGGPLAMPPPPAIPPPPPPAPLALPPPQEGSSVGSNEV